MKKYIYEFKQKSPRDISLEKAQAYWRGLLVEMGERGFFPATHQNDSNLFIFWKEVESDTRRVDSEKP